MTDHLTDTLVGMSPCANCGCGAYCHWDHLNTPAEGEAAATWAYFAAQKKLPCQRCPKCKKGYRER